MGASQLEAFKKELIIHPLVFEEQKDRYTGFEYVKPNYINKDKPPITMHDVKEIKTYLNAIMKCQSNYYKKKRAFRNVFVRQERIEKEDNGACCDFDVKDFESTLSKKSITIPYDPVSKKSLRSAIRMAEQAAKAYKKDETGFYKNFQEYIKYLRYLYSRKTVKADISLTELEMKSKKSLNIIIRRLNFLDDKALMNKYIPPKLAKFMPTEYNVEEPAFTWPDDEKLLEMCKQYEKHCETLVKIVEETTEKRENVTIDLTDFKDLPLDRIVKVKKYEKKISDGKVTLSAAQDLLEDNVKELDGLTESTKSVMQKIEPFADKLFASASKANVYGLNTLYTRLSESLNESVAKLRNVMMSVVGKKKQMMSVSLGLDKIVVGGQSTVVTKTWSSQLSTVDDLNTDSEKCYEKLDRRNLFRTSTEFANLYTSVLGKIKSLNEYMAENLKAERVEDMKNYLTNIDPDDLKQYALKMKQSLNEVDDVKQKTEEVFKDSKRLIDETSKSLFGKIILFKEKHKTTLETLKLFTKMAQTISSQLPL